MLGERQRLTEELVVLEAQLDDPWLSFSAAGTQWIVGCETGDRSQVDSALAAMSGLATTVQQPSFVWLQLLDECIAMLIQGDLQSSERIATEAFDAGSASGEPDAALALGGQLFIVRYHQGRAGELADQLMQVAELPESLPAWRAAAAVCLMHGGRPDEARQLLLAENFEDVPMDAVWSGTIYGWAEVCSDLGLVERAAELYQLFAPFPDQIASGGSVFYGSIAWPLGRLATTLERYELAEEHFAAAAHIDERLGAPLFLARTHASWAQALIARGRPEDLDRAGPMLEQAEGAARRAGADRTIREVAGGRAALAAALPAGTRGQTT